MSFLAFVPEPCFMRRVLVGCFLSGKSGYNLDSRYPNQAHKHLGFHHVGVDWKLALRVGKMLKLGLVVSQCRLWFVDSVVYFLEE